MHEAQNATRAGNVRCLIVAPAPLSDDWVGGISNFIRGFIAHAPDDFDIAVCGVVSAADAHADGERSAGWRPIDVAGRRVSFLPVARLGTGGGRIRTPVKARELAGLLAARPHIPTSGRVLQLHAPVLDRAFVGRRNAPIIRVVHNSPTNLASPMQGTAWRRLGWALRRIEEASYRRAERVFFVDRATYDQYRVGDDGSRMRHLPNGVETDRFRVRESHERDAMRAQAAESLGIRGDAPWILFCGRLDRQKDPDLLIRTFAAARALPELAGAQLLIVGAGPLEQKTRDEARQAGVADATHFVGAVRHDRLPDLMSACDVLVLTSAYEGTPFVVLEALAAGLPVVSTAVGDVPRLVHHAQAGWLSSSRSADELARGLAWAVAQPRDEIAIRCSASMSGYGLEAVLAPFYEEHRRVAATAR
jgi:glycosyltransferase involved in cell wall biosynthesis